MAHLITPFRKRTGLTLVEVLVVVLVIGILAVIAIVSLNTARRTARDAVRATDIDLLEKSLVLYETENQFVFPVSSSCTAALGNAVDGICDSASGQNPWIPGMTARYIDTMPTDPGGHDDPALNRYIYISPWNQYRYMLGYYPEHDTPEDHCGYGVPGATTYCESQ
jgi:general secretion pathway protein G